MRWHNCPHLPTEHPPISAPDPMHPNTNAASHTTPGRIACWVTGTDTEIGKTLVSTALLHGFGALGLRTLGIKPIAAGADEVAGVLHNEDVDALAAVCSEQPPLTQRTPYLLRTPAAPHVAARLEGVSISPTHIAHSVQHLRTSAEAVVVEGVGGFRVPLTDVHDTADLAVELGLPVVLVVGLRLGCISQALLTAEAITARGLSLIGWVANSTQVDMPHEADNIQALRERLAAPLLGHVPRLTSSASDAAARARDLAAQAAACLDDAALRAAFQIGAI